MDTVWVCVGSHRARSRLQQAVGDPGQSYGLAGEDWVGGKGEYYKIPAVHAAALNHIKGLRVLRGTPGNGAPLFKYRT